MDNLNERIEEYLTWVESSLHILGNDNPKVNAKIKLGSFMESIKFSGKLIRDMQARIKELEGKNPDYLPESTYIGLSMHKKLMAELEVENQRLREAQELTESVSKDISEYIVGHIRQMYPEQYKIFTPSLRKSLKGCIANAWNFHIKQLPESPKE